MRVRRLVTMSFGAAVGAGAMYLFDPEHGEVRRRDVRKRAWSQARHGGVRMLHDARDQAQALALAAIDGYQQSRDADEGSGSPAPPTGVSR